MSEWTPILREYSSDSLSIHEHKIAHVQAAKLAFLIGNVLAVLISHTGRHLSAIGSAQVRPVSYGIFLVESL
jgi:hypothetical protein